MGRDAAAPPAARAPGAGGPPAGPPLAFRDGPRVSSGAWVGACHSAPASLGAAEAACGADAECVLLHDARCDGEHVRRCWRGAELVELVDDRRDSDGCTRSGGRSGGREGGRRRGAGRSQEVGRAFVA
ncbi:unnamed protein product [Prorocentrum cordatum]|uniref:Uncharacterized protein n=1 Tax=Prorocentrum cordatum TaxID=2364126 RepID=A0ABN9TER4_9DINO|nr:unnamed protein product [Polarella glacialis]